MKQVIDLMGKNVNFTNNIKVENVFYSKKIEGMVTDILLSLDGNHQVAVDNGDFFVLSDLLDFKVIDSI
jgi:proteasome assembly chaperone (PAC2) family protein